MFHPRYVTLQNGRAVLIRAAEPRDAEALIDEVNEVGSEMVYIMTEKLRLTPDQESEMIRRIDPSRTLFLVAVADERVVGSADIQRGRESKNAHTANLGLSLRKEVRGLGLGKALMEDLLRWARSEGIRKVTLAVFETNRPAMALYRDFGFAEEGRRKGEVVLNGTPVDEVLMAVWL